MGGKEYHITQVWCGVLHKVTFISNLLWLIRWGTPQETCWWQEVIPLVHLMALSDGCESHHVHNAKRNSLIHMGAFPSSGIRGLDSNHHSFSDAELPRTYCAPWTYVSRWQFTVRSPSPSELNFTLTVVHTHTHTHTHSTWSSSVFKCQDKVAVGSNHPVSLTSAFPGIFCHFITTEILICQCH